MGGLGFPKTEMSESIRDNPNRRLSDAGVTAGDFAHDPGPASRGRQTVRSGHADGGENVRNARWRAALDLNVVLAMPNLN